MWPFASSKRDDEVLGVNRAEFDDLMRRVKLIEREHDDLHAAYRRLRAARAVEARDAPPLLKETRQDDPDATVEQPFDKNALRRKYLLKPGNNLKTA
jgi:hypothetical protein